tara:strand:+ start:996 stop:1535 length:540 start_codon:yes stop_codon:yes gene_type:complete
MGIGGITIGVIIAHFAGFPKGEVIDYFNWMPRGWLMQTFGQLVAFGAGQLFLLGMAMLAWQDTPMTWTRAAYLSLLSWIQLTLIFGVLPSEWLNLSQGPLEWTNQREFIKFPPILFLGNEISLSLGALKDIIQVGISQGALVTVIVGGYLIQDLNNAKERGKTRISDYGKTVVKAGDDG